MLWMNLLLCCCKGPICIQASRLCRHNFAAAAAAAADISFNINSNPTTDCNQYSSTPATAVLSGIALLSPYHCADSDWLLLLSCATHGCLVCIAVAAVLRLVLLDCACFGINLKASVQHFLACVQTAVNRQCMAVLGSTRVSGRFVSSCCEFNR